MKATFSTILNEFWTGFFANFLKMDFVTPPPPPHNVRPCPSLNLASTAIFTIVPIKDCSKYKLDKRIRD